MNECIEGPEYGSMKSALKSCMESVDRLAECHIAVKDRLMSVVQARVKEWRNENYKKSLMGGCREAKSFEDDFRKVSSCKLLSSLFEMCSGLLTKMLSLVPCPQK